MNFFIFDDGFSVNLNQVALVFPKINTKDEYVIRFKFILNTDYHFDKFYDRKESRDKDLESILSYLSKESNK